MKTEQEIWKDVPGYEGLYQASNCGRIRSLDRVVKFKDGRQSFKKGVVLAHEIRKDETHKVKISKNNNSKCVAVHRIIALAFIPNPNSLPQVNHIDGSRHNNNVDNLEWITISGNIKHAYDMGLLKPTIGEKHPRAKLTESDVRSILNDNRPHNEIAKDYGVKRSTVYDIKSRKRWKHITCK